MPIYEFVCEGCNIKIEALVLTKEESSSSPLCKECNLLMSKVISTIGTVKLKGENWEKDGYGLHPKVKHNKQK